MKSARRLLALALALAACGLVLLSGDGEREDIWLANPRRRQFASAVTGLRGPSQRAALLSASRGNSLAPAPPPRLGSGLDGILSESEDAHSLADAKVLLKKRAGNSLASLDTFFDASGQERPFVPETTITGFCGTWRDTKMSSTEGFSVVGH
ncbi:hypothetical protein T484DRAFT_1808454 [Baffinella frigidus]|nr:hypothetical protein T484DRAFT_1808454 [Cryptophyta sp. CCMP2293]